MASIVIIQGVRTYPHDGSPDFKAIANKSKFLLAGTNQPHRCFQFIPINRLAWCGRIKEFDMNKDQIVGAGRSALAKGEHSLGKAIGNGKVEAENLIDEVGAVVQKSIGRLIDRVTELVEETPDLFTDAMAQGRHASQRGNAIVRKRLGDNGSKYLVVGAIGLIVLGMFAARRR